MNKFKKKKKKKEERRQSIVRSRVKLCRGPVSGPSKELIQG